MKTDTLNALLNALTSFRTIDELRQAQQERGYVPTMYARNGKWRRLIRATKAAGVKVWPNS